MGKKRSAPAGVPSAAGVREPTPLAADVLPFSFLHVNVRGIKSKLVVLCRLLAKEKPIYVVLTETWLDPSTETVAINGYVAISRLDLAASPHGGVLVLAKEK